MKKLFDILASLIALVILIPVFIFIAVFIFVSDPGPIFYRQERVGKYGVPFRLYKFRSMRIDADKIGPYFTSDNDPRITKVGKLLRKSSLDELPQLINVLLGQMSIVGPRPNVFAQQVLYTEAAWDKRNQVIPGITGLAQATLRSSATEGQRERLDLYYVENATFVFDIKIILMTVKQVIFKGGN